MRTDPPALGQFQRTLRKGLQLGNVIPSRRHLLQSGAAAMVAAAMPLTSVPASSRLNVAIVGAGLAELACADELRKQSIRATIVLRSLQPAGGRCYSLRDSPSFPGQVVERDGGRYTGEPPLTLCNKPTVLKAHRLYPQRRTVMADYTTTDIIKRYLQDAIAAENTFESQLRGMAKEGNDPQAHALFQQHAEETKSQIDRLTARLRALGESPSTMKSFMAHMFAFAPKSAQLGHDEAERVSQNLMMAYAVEHSEIAMYEALATVAAAAGDQITATLARDIQAEEQRTADKVWAMIPTASTDALSKLVGQMSR